MPVSIVSTVIVSVAVMVTSIISVITIPAIMAVVVVMTIIASVPAVAHTTIAMTIHMGTIVVVSMFVVAATTVHSPAMSAPIGDIEAGTTEIVVITIRVAGIDAKMPVAGTPIEWAIEISGCTESIPLPAI